MMRPGIQGCHVGVEAYSAFEASFQSSSLALSSNEEPSSVHPGLLAKYLEDNAVDRMVVVGLAADYVSVGTL
jgi:nicotinamidase-related amidase